jgi:hypothetical protein
MSEFRLADDLRRLDGPVTPDDRISDQVWTRLATEFDESRSTGTDRARLGRGILVAAVAAIAVLAVIVPVVFFSGSGGGPVASSEAIVLVEDWIDGALKGDFEDIALLTYGESGEPEALDLLAREIHSYADRYGQPTVAISPPLEGGPISMSQICVRLDFDEMVLVGGMVALAWDDLGLRLWEFRQNMQECLGASTVTTTHSAEPSLTTTQSAEPSISSSTPIELDQPVPFRLLAVGTSGPGTTVIDLFEREVVTYSAGAGVLPVDRRGGAVAAPNGAWITSSGIHAYLFADGLDQVTAELGPGRVRSMAGIAASLRAVPDPGGERVWLVQPGLGYADHDEPTLVQLVRFGGGPAILEAEIDPNAGPVAATASGLILNTHDWFDTGDGFVTAPGTERVLHLRTDGVIESVGPGVPIAAGPDRIARLVCPVDRTGCDPYAEANRLIVSNPDGTDPVEVQWSFEGVWRSVGGPVPTDSMLLQAASPAGIEMLVSISRTVDVNASQIDPTLVAVSLDDGTSRAIADIGPVFAAWSGDGQWIVVISGRDLVLIDSEDSDRVIELADLLPENFAPLAAG